MNVLVRNTRSDRRTRRRGGISSGRGTQAQTAAAVRGPAAEAPSAEHTARVPGSDDGAPHRRRMHGPTQDNALYNCHCGYVFEASVSTSVGCPHCGTDQAW